MSHTHLKLAVNSFNCSSDTPIVFLYEQKNRVIHMVELDLKVVDNHMTVT